MKRAVLVFLKWPEPGRVKTRLAAGIGAEEALCAYRQMVARVLEQCRNSGAEVLALAYDPAEKEEEIRRWLAPYLSGFFGEVLWIPQGGGDLGGRLEAAVEVFFHRFPGVMLSVIGTDCVQLERTLFDEAGERLETSADVVFGPTADGGYYLVAMKCPQPALFRGIPWSAATTLSASLAAAEGAGLRTHLLPARIDVDTVDGWREVASDLSDRKCVFFDRDGVVNRSPGSGYVLRKEDFFLNPGIPGLLAWLRENGVLTILVTSQKGVGKGLMSESGLDAIHGFMQQELSAAGGGFDAIYAFTGTPDCPYPPKPEPGMIDAAVEGFFVDRKQSWMIGDADRDIAMGKAAGLAGTIRISGEKPIGVAADYTLSETAGIINLLEKFL